MFHEEYTRSTVVHWQQLIKSSDVLIKYLEQNNRSQGYLYSIKLCFPGNIGAKKTKAAAISVVLVFAMMQCNVY